MSQNRHVIKVYIYIYEITSFDKVERFHNMTTIIHKSIKLLYKLFRELCFILATKVVIRSIHSMPVLTQMILSHVGQKNCQKNISKETARGGKRIPT